MKAVFFVSTEYQLLITLGVINKYYSGDDDQAIIYQVLPTKGKRVRLEGINPTAMKCRYEKMTYDYSHPTKDLKNKIKGIISERPDILFVCLEERSWHTYLFSKLHKLGTKIVLLPDGMKVYMLRRRSQKTIFRETSKFLLKNIRIGIPFPIAKYPYAYGATKYIDEVWMEYPDKYENISKKIVKQFTLPSHAEFIDELNQVFGYSMSAEEEKLIKGGPIVLLDSPFAEDSYYQRTVDIISRIKEKYPNRKLLIKQHQLSFEKARTYFDSLEDVTYLRTGYPAELYIANMENAIIISMYSTAMLFYNPTCRYYWIGDCYRDLMQLQEIINPTPYIQVVSSVEEI